MSTIPQQFQHLVDDAAIFPPGNAPMSEAVRAHREHRKAPYADLVGPFVVSDTRLPELIEVLRAEPGEPLPVNVVVSGGAGAIEPAVRWSVRADELTLRCVEIALRDEADLAHNARRVVAVVDQLRDAGELDEDAPVFVEPGRPDPAQPTTGWFGALDEIAARELSLKFRTGGVDADAFPSAAELAVCIDSALDRELPFKCTAGLHNASRHRDDKTGFEHHGFLNVLAATRTSLDGGDVVEVLEDPAVGARLRDLDPTALVSARRWFTSFGSCSVLEPLEDLIDLDLLPDLPLESA